MPLIDQNLLNDVCAEAQASPRQRKNRNFHSHDQAPCHRLLNAIEPGSYVAPHRHLDPNKEETMIVLRGRLGCVEFDEQGGILSYAALSIDHGVMAINLPVGRYHTVFALEPNTVFFEAKAGPYQPLSPEEKAPWAPAENSPDAPAYLQSLTALFTQ